MSRQTDLARALMASRLLAQQSGEINQELQLTNRTMVAKAISWGHNVKMLGNTTAQCYNLHAWCKIVHCYMIKKYSNFNVNMPKICN
jgi:hypothetical protein